jgi:UDP:flavonoid glycosyltransferase YjiC (YdhE family)
MHLLAVSAQLPGHLDWGGYLHTAAELARRGHQVTWASGAAVAPQVRQAGIPFAMQTETGWRWPPPPPLIPDPAADPTEVQQQKQVRALDQWLDPARVAAAAAELSALAGVVQPDLILTEMFTAAAGLVAEQLDVPLVVVGWPAPAAQSDPADDAMTTLARARLDELLRPLGLVGKNFSPQGPPALCSPHLHLTYWTAGWYAGAALGAQTVHVGGLAAHRPPGLLPDPNLPHPDDAPWVLITLGTSFNADPNFFMAAAHAADQLGCLPLLAVGAPLTTPWCEAMLPRLPRRAVMRTHVDFATTLPFVAAAIHHGGAGTTHALATHAIPQIVVPHAADQIRQAQGLLRTGAGLHLAPKQVTIARLVDGLAQALPDRGDLRGHAVALQVELDALGGVPAAAKRIEALGREV